MKHEITIKIDSAMLESYSDSFLATAHHVAQANPAPIENRNAGELADAIRNEIVRRWLKAQEPERYHHTSAHYFWDICQRAGKWQDGEWRPNSAAPASNGRTEL